MSPTISTRKTPKRSKARLAFEELQPHGKFHTLFTGTFISGFLFVCLCTLRPTPHDDNMDMDKKAMATATVLEGTEIHAFTDAVN